MQLPPHFPQQKKKTKPVLQTPYFPFTSATIFHATLTTNWI